MGLAVPLRKLDSRWAPRALDRSYAMMLSILIGMSVAIPQTVIGGFHGAGKTMLLEAEAWRRPVHALIVNAVDVRSSPKS